MVFQRRRCRLLIQIQSVIQFVLNEVETNYNLQTQTRQHSILLKECAYSAAYTYNTSVIERDGARRDFFIF